MVDKFRQILTEIERQHGQVTLFAVMKMDDLTDKWSIILTAPWATQENSNAIYQAIVALINREFSIEEKASIARLVMGSVRDHLTEDLLRYHTGAEIREQVRLNGNLVHEAYILASNP